MTEQRKRLGRRGEQVAARWLQRHGLQVLERNWRCRAGEIDIIARDGTTLVVVEVKTRTSTRYGSPAAAVAGPKLARLRRLAGEYLRAHPQRAAAIRVDVIAVLSRADGSLWLQHLKGVT